MKTLIEKLAGYALNAHTGDGEAFIVRLTEWREEGQSAFEHLARAVPLDLLRLPGEPAVDELGGFLATCCTCRSFDKARSTPLFDAFKEYSGDREISAVKFTAMLEQRGFEKYRISAGSHRGKMGWRGIGLLADDCETANCDSEPTAAEGGF